VHNNYGEKDNESLLLHYGFCQQESPLKAPPGAGSPDLWLRRAARRTRHKPRRRSGPNMTGCGAAVKAPAEAADAAASCHAGGTTHTTRCESRCRCPCSAPRCAYLYMHTSICIPLYAYLYMHTSICIPPYAYLYMHTSRYAHTHAHAHAHAHARRQMHIESTHAHAHTHTCTHASAHA
jgi:hypothetical protein